MDTKELLANALKQKMREKPIEKITIHDLTTIVGINRQTFYYHFHDIYELISYMYYHKAMDAIGDNNTIETWKQGLLRLFLVALEEKEFITQTFRSIPRDRAEDFLYGIMSDLIIHAINETSASLLLQEEDKELVSTFYKHALIGMLLSWIQDGMKKDPVVLVDKIEIIARDGFVSAISAFATRSTD